MFSAENEPSEDGVGPGQILQPGKTVCNAPYVLECNTPLCQSTMHPLYWSTLHSVGWSALYPVYWSAMHLLCWGATHPSAGVQCTPAAYYPPTVGLERGCVALSIDVHLRRNKSMRVRVATLHCYTALHVRDYKNCLAYRLLLYP